jgi:hypothetical protein
MVTSFSLREHTGSPWQDKNPRHKLKSKTRQLVGRSHLIQSQSISQVQRSKTKKAGQAGSSGIIA